MFGIIGIQASSHISAAGGSSSPSLFASANLTFSATAAATKTTSTLALLAGDVVVSVGSTEDYTSTQTLTASASPALTFTLRQDIKIASYAECDVWTAVVGTGGDHTVSIAKAYSGGTQKWWGGSVFIFRGSDGVGASSKTNVNNGAPSLNLTTTQANSAIVVCTADWNAIDGASRTWRANAGALTEQNYQRDAAAGTSYAGYHADAGAIGTYAVGLSSPSGQKYAIVALEVLGS